MKTLYAVLIFFGIPALIVLFAGMIGEYEKTGPRLVRLEYRWNLLEKDRWMYAPTDVDIWAPTHNDNDPIGVIGKTSEGAWKAVWRWKSCGGGEYLTRELAERCVEGAAADDGLLGYHFKVPKPAPEVKP